MSVNMKQNGSLTKIASLTKAIIPMGLAEYYSTEERQVGVWTDGKPLYQKTVYIASVTSGTSYAHGAENVENIFIKNIKAKRNVGWFSSGHIFQDRTDYISESFSIIPSPTVLYAYLYGNTITDCSVTIQYTKTTDTAGSGIWTPQGSYAHHYSTIEQIIGTWLDNKPLYEQAFLQTTFSANANTWYKTAIPRGSMKYLIDVFVVFENATAPSVHKGMSGGFVDGYLAINSFRNVGIDAGTTCYVVAQYTKTTD